MPDIRGRRAIPQVHPTDLPGLQITTSPGAAMAQVGSGLFDFAAQRQGERKKRELILAEREGRTAGAVEVDASGEPILVQREEATAAAEAFNRAARAGYLARVELSTRRQIAQIATEHRNDPAAMTAAISAWTEGMKEGLPPDMVPNYELAVQQLASPHITAATNRVLTAQADSRKDTLIALENQRLADVRTNAGYFAQGDVKGLDQIRDTYTNHLADLQAAVDGITYTAGDARLAMQDFQSDLAENYLFGFYAGLPAHQKDGFFDRVVRGEVSVPFPVLVKGADGELTVEMQNRNPAELLDQDGFNNMRTTMAGISNRMWETGQRARTAFNQQTDDFMDTSMAALYRTRDPGLYAQIRNSPYATAAQLAEADKIMAGEVGATDWAAYEDMEQRILEGTTYTEAELYGAPLAADQRDAIREMQETVSEFEKTPTYERAEERIKLDLGRVISDVSTVVGGTASEKKSRQLEAAAAMQNQLLSEVVRKQRDGYQIGNIASGAAEEERDGVKVFDPFNWVTGRIDAMKGQIEPLMEEIEALQAQVRAGRTETSRLSIEAAKDPDMKEAYRRAVEQQDALFYSLAEKQSRLERLMSGEVD